MKKIIKTIALLSLIAGAMPLMALEAEITQDLSSSPIYTTIDLVRTSIIASISPFSSTTDLSSAGMEEAELRVVKDDVLEYFATGEPTDRLVSTVEVVQGMVPDLEDEDFDTVAITILKAIN